MNSRRLILCSTVSVALLLETFSNASPACQQDEAYSTIVAIKADVEMTPCKNEARLDAVKALFEKMGATPQDLSVEKFKKVENLVITKRGSSDERIVVGAHYDKVSEGCGAVDNWSGIIALAHLYKTLRLVPLKKTLIFVAFGKEESGLVGSHAMVSAIPKEQTPLYCAMINIDSLGLGRPQVADNLANEKLERLTEGIAKEMEMPFSHSYVYGDSDSSSFRDRKIPALTIHGLTNEYTTLLHTSKDTTSKVNAVSIYNAYSLVLRMIASIVDADCNAFR